MLSMGIGQALRNTFIYSIVVTLGSIALGMLVAILLNREFVGRGIVRSLFLTPWVVPQFVTGLLFGFMWQQSAGIINIILYDFLSINEWVPFISDTKPFWLMGDPLTLVAIIIPTIWRGFPHSMLMLMAGLTTISQDYYEAAEIDGANDWQKFWKITFPLLKPVWSILLLFGMIFNVYSFNIVIMMFGNGAGFPGDWGDLMMTNIFRNSFQQWNFGIGAAVSIVLMFIMMIAVSLWYRLYKQVEEG
jgi:multiple sugar transport system permease protein